MSRKDSADYHFWRANELAIMDRNQEALDHLVSALAIEPRHVMSLVLLGDLHLFDSEEFGLEVTEGRDAAIAYYDMALGCEWKHADPWSGKALALTYKDEPEQALATAEIGLMVLPLSIGSTMDHPPVHNNIAETLFKVKVYSLLALDRAADAREALSDGFAYCPESTCLTDVIYDVMPAGMREL